MFFLYTKHKKICMPHVKNPRVAFKRADAHAFIKTLPSQSVDLVYSDPPFGTTKNKWDTSMDWELLFREFERVLRPNGTIVLHSAMPFTYDLMRVKRPNYHYVWVKERATNFFNVKTQPMRRHEEILVWVNTPSSQNATSIRPPTYNPQMTGSAWKATSYTTSAEYYKLHHMKGDYKRHIHSPRDGHTGTYPDSVLYYKRHIAGFSTRPKQLIDYVLKTYSNEGDMVLDISCYRGLTGVCAKLLGRSYMGVDVQHISRRRAREMHRSLVQGGGGGDPVYLQERLRKFYTSAEHADAFMRITGYDSGQRRSRAYHLRHVDHFVRQTCRRHATPTLRALHRSYRTTLRDYTKEQFDPYCRADRHPFPMGPSSKTVVTTVAQLNYVRWLIQHAVVRTLIPHLATVRSELGLRAVASVPGSSPPDTPPSVPISTFPPFSSHVPQHAGPVPANRSRRHAPWARKRARKGGHSRDGHWVGQDSGNPVRRRPTS